MCIGLRNAALRFQRYIDSVLHGISNAFCYVDSILVASIDCKTREHDLAIVFDKPKERPGYQRL